MLWTTVFLAGDRHDPGLGLRNKVVAGQRTVRSVEGTVTLLNPTNWKNVE